MKIMEEQGIKAHSLIRNTLGGKGRVGSLDGNRENDKHLITHIDLHKLNNKLVSA
jgi:hypothetical protein